MATYMSKWEDIIKKAKETPEYQAEKMAFQIALRIGELLDEINIPRRDLAKKLKVSKSYVTQILQGKNNMTILSLCKIANALNVEPVIELREMDREYINMQYFDYQNIPCTPIPSYLNERAPEYLDISSGVDVLGTAECTITSSENKTKLPEAV